jgi:hypothetical protein
MLILLSAVNFQEHSVLQEGGRPLHSSPLACLHDHP